MHQTFEHHFGTLVVGGGQADLATGCFLVQQDRDLRDPRCQEPGRGRLAQPLGFATSSPVCRREGPPRHPANKH